MTSAARAQTTDVALGIEALARRDVKGAEAAFRRGTKSDNPLIRPAAWQWLGHVAWKFRGDFPAAARALDSALATARDSSQVQLEIARLDAARRRYRDAFRVGGAAFHQSGDAERRGIVARALADIAMDAVFAAGKDHFRDSLDLALLGEVRDTLVARVARFPGRTTDALALIDLGAVLQDPLRIIDALKSYTAFVDPSLRRRVDSIGRKSAWSAMAGLGLYEPFSVFMKTLVPGPQGIAVDAPEASEEYGEWLHGLRRSLDAVYRRELAGTARPGDVTRLVNAEGRRLWGTLPFHDDEGRPPYVPADAQRELSRRFGTVMSIERSRGVDELYLAHDFGVIARGRADSIRVLDGVIAAGFDDWLLDGTGGRAGWVDGDWIFERRTGFTETPFRALLALTDPQTIPGELFRLSRDSVGDVARAARDSLGYLPGVAARIFRDGARRLMDSVKTPEAFTRAMFDNLTRTTIALHEARHRADARRVVPSTPADDEFRAKIDEVTGAPLPRLSLTAILTPNIGDGSPHGQANRRIMIGLNRWIRRNGARVAGYDRKVPALLQLPYLTDEQLRAAFESMRVP